MYAIVTACRFIVIFFVFISFLFYFFFIHCFHTSTCINNIILLRFGKHDYAENTQNRTRARWQILTMFFAVKENSKALYTVI